MITHTPFILSYVGGFYSDIICAAGIFNHPLERKLRDDTVAVFKIKLKPAK